MIYSGGHKLRPYISEESELADFLELDPGVAHMFCRNCGWVDPEPGSECDDNSTF